ncbi:MAG: hypothetical protein KIT36_20930 [Alphaproteobacteria bacterium]|nr:hypothetical protein [Alphaproteobacteria bacterium]
MDYDDIRRYAEVSVRRGCGFALIAIFSAMVGASAEPDICFRLGAALAALMTVVLYWRGRTAPTRNFRRTEVWLMIEDAPALPRERLQGMIGTALAEVYMAHAWIAAWTTLLLCAVAAVMAVTPGAR